MARSDVRVAVLFLVLTAVFVPSTGRSQSLWFPRSTPRALLIEALHPDFESFDEDIASGALFVGFRAPLGQGASILIELPAARFAGEGDDAFSPGNPYLGAEYTIEGSPLFIEAGARISMFDIDEVEAILTGVVSDVNRWEAFVDANSFTVGINARHVSPGGAMVRARIAPVASVVSSSFGGSNWDWYILYSLQVGYEGSLARAGAGVLARTMVNDYMASFGERTFTQGDLHADFGSGVVRPGIDVKVPLDELNDAVPVVLGVSLRLAFD